MLKELVVWLNFAIDIGMAALLCKGKPEERREQRLIEVWEAREVCKSQLKFVASNIRSSSILFN
jgi:hypothetical protein